MAIDRVRVLGLVLACAGAATSCITSPETNTVVDSARVPVQLQGQLPIEYGTIVTVQYLTTGLTWANLGSVITNRDGLWQFSATLPANGWLQPCGVATLRAISNTNQTLVVRDDACVTALVPNAAPEDISKCYTSMLYLHQPHVQQGDVTIVGAAQAAPFQCTTKIVGNLTVDGLTSPSTSLPSLHDVTGNVDVTLHRYVDTVPNPDQYPAGRFQAPILATIGGSVALHTIKDSGVVASTAATYDFGMDAVTSVGGDILVDNTAFPGFTRGLNALTSLAGNLTVNWAPNDVNAMTILSSLEKVEGNVTVSVNPNANSLLRALEQVGQDLTISTPVASSWHTNTNGYFFESLTTVDGNLNLHKADTSCTTLKALEYVGGTLTFENSSLSSDGYLGAASGVPLSVGALAVIDGNATIAPVGPDLEVRNDGNVTLTNNTNLCDCSTSALVAQLEASGWAGVATTSGNGATASCMPCPAPATCP